MVHHRFDVKGNSLLGGARAAALSAITLAVGACRGPEHGPIPEGVSSCRVDQDCPTNHRCEPVTAKFLAALPLPMTAPPVCLEVECTVENQSTLCSEEQTCVPIAQAIRLDSRPWDSRNCPDLTQVCGTPCKGPEDCAEGELCRDDGRCELTTCDEAGAPACPTGMHCDPAAAATLANPAVVGVAYDSAFRLGHTRGCVFTTCDQPGGVVCQTLWRCEPLASSDRGGCVAIDCRESGQCSTEYMICNPTSTERRPATSDSHGCVARNCEEGLECHYVVQGRDVGYCDFDGPYSSATGCAARPCDQVNGLCYGALVCDPDSPQADERGCRQRSCEEGVTCAGQSVCAPHHPQADAVGCIVADVAVSPTATSVTADPPTEPAVVTDPLSSSATATSTAGSAALPVNAGTGTDRPAAGVTVGVCVEGR